MDTQDIKQQECVYCNKIKPLDDFYLSYDRKTKTHHRKNVCNECCRVRQNHYYSKERQCLVCKEWKSEIDFKGEKRLCLTCFNSIKSRKCKCCGETKEQNEFNIREVNDNGIYLFRTCKKCKNARRKILKFKNPAKYILKSAKDRARKTSILFNLEEEDIIIPEYCPILGVRLVMGNSFENKNNSPSLDRLVPENGYTKGNVRIISQRANIIKNCGTAEEHEKIAKWMRENGCK